MQDAREEIRRAVERAGSYHAVLMPEDGLADQAFTDEVERSEQRDAQGLKRRPSSTRPW
jgi:hypothetical protein